MGIIYYTRTSNPSGLVILLPHGTGKNVFQPLCYSQFNVASLQEGNITFNPFSKTQSEMYPVFINSYDKAAAKWHSGNATGCLVK